MSIEYRPVPEFPGYRGGSDGSVWSQRDFNGGTSSAWRELRQADDKDGYKCVTLYKNGRPKRLRVAAVILMAFVGPRPLGHVACHYPDRDLSNNRSDNLIWATHLENIRHKIEHGTERRGDGHPRAKHSERQLLQALRLRGQGIPVAEVSRRTGLSKTHVYRVYHGTARKNKPQAVGAA